MLKKKTVDPLLEKQWKKYQKSIGEPKLRSKLVGRINDESLLNIIVNDLEPISKMGVNEYIFFQKWWEIREKYPGCRQSTLGGDTFVYDNVEQQRFIQRIKHNIWIPKTPEDFRNLKPRLVSTDDSEVIESPSPFGGTQRIEIARNKELPEIWNCIRNFISTMKNSSNIGRNLNYLVVDEVTGKYLGVICLSSDFLDLTPRDNHIGWPRDLKTTGGKINHTAIGSTIVPFQPLGYNHVGGKLLALLCLSDRVQEDWKSRYGDTLVGVTTTSLYGKSKPDGMSQYDGLKHWKKMGFSSGSVSFQPTKPTIKLMLEWLEYNHPRKYFEWYVAIKPSGQPYKRDHRNRSYSFIYSQLKVPKELIKADHYRGIYFSELYENTCEFLRGEITEDKLVKKFDTSEEYLSKLWLDKYAEKRYNSLIKNNREFSNQTLFYDDLSWLSWAESKKKYLGDVGR